MRTNILDKIYSTCLKWLDVPTTDDYIKNNPVFKVDTENYGLLQSCGNIPDMCMDDCFFGISLYNLKPYQQQQPSNDNVSMISKKNKRINDEKLKKNNNDGNSIVYSIFLLFINIFIVKAIVCAYSY
jgi:hypothetical protein